jgi:KDO2-lipid IV(A) lauroyltransferase
MRHRPRHYLEYFGVRVLVLGVCLLPLRLALGLGSFLGGFAFRPLGIRRRATLQNLERCLGNVTSPAERLRIGEAAYRQIGMTLVEYSRFLTLRREEILKAVEFEGLEHFDRALGRGKGAVLFAGHFGSWELMGAAIRARGYPVHYLVGEQHNRLVDDLMNRLRTAAGIGIIPMGMSVRGVLRALRDNQFVALLSDQDAGSGGVFVDFFGAPASTPQGPAVFALKTGAPILAGFSVRLKGGRHRVVLEPPIHCEPSGNPQDDVVRCTQAYTSVLESYVRRYPDHWFWPHRRWKTRPPEATLHS